MTIAVGFVAEDGIVLAADTKESYGELHTFIHKLEVIDSPRCSGALAGSGYSYPVEYIAPKIKELFEAGTYKTAEDCERALGSLMSLIYQSKSMRAFPKSGPQDIYTSFLVVIRHKEDGKPVLLLTNSSLVSRIESGAKIIGQGIMQGMADEIARLHLSVDEAKIASLYLVWETKRRTSDVGGQAHIYGVTADGQIQIERTWDQPARETLFESLQSMQYFLTTKVANPHLPPTEFNQSLASFRKTILKIRREFQKIEKKYQLWSEEQNKQLLDSLFNKTHRKPKRRNPLLNAQKSEREP